MDGLATKESFAHSRQVPVFLAHTSFMSTTDN
jgi:hypothetical protein